MNFTSQNTLKDRSFSWEHIPPKFVSPNKQLLLQKNIKKCTMRPQTGYPTQKQKDQMLLGSDTVFLNLPDRDFLVQNSKSQGQEHLDQQILNLIQQQLNIQGDQILNQNQENLQQQINNLQYFHLLRFKNSFKQRKSQSTDLKRKTAWYKIPLYEENPNPPNKKGIIPEEGINNKNMELYYKLNYEMDHSQQEEEIYQYKEDNDINLSFRENVQGHKFTQTKEQYENYIRQIEFEKKLKKQQEKMKQLQQQQQLNNQLYVDQQSGTIVFDNQDEIFDFLNEYEQRNNLQNKYGDYMVQQIQNQQHYIINEQDEQEQQQNTFDQSSCIDKTNIDQGFNEKKKLIELQHTMNSQQQLKSQQIKKYFEKQNQNIEKPSPEQLNQKLFQSVEKLAKTRKNPKKQKVGIQHYPKIGNQKFGIQKNYEYEDMKKHKTHSQDVQNLLNQIKNEFYLPGNVQIKNEQAFQQIKEQNNQNQQLQKSHNKKISITQQEKQEKYDNYVSDIESGKISTIKPKLNIDYDLLKMEKPKYLKNQKTLQTKKSEKQIQNRKESQDIRENQNESKTNESNNKSRSKNISKIKQVQQKKPQQIISQTANLMNTYLTDLDNELGGFEVQEINDQKTKASDFDSDSDESEDQF